MNLFHSKSYKCHVQTKVSFIEDCDRIRIWKVGNFKSNHKIYMQNTQAKVITELQQPGQQENQYCP